MSLSVERPRLCVLGFEDTLGHDPVPLDLTLTP